MNDIQINDPRERFIIARWAYSVNSPIITDAEYTTLLEYMKSMYPDDSYLTHSWSSDTCPMDLLAKYNLQYLADSVTITDLTESIPSLNTYSDLEAELKSFNGSGTLSMKHDGWNIQAFYYDTHLVKVQTRGRVTNAMNADVLRNKFPQTVPWMGSVNVVHEATVSRGNFAFCRQTFNNVDERSAVHTVLSKPEYLHLIDVHAVDIHGVDLGDRCKFDVLSEAGFNVPRHIKVGSFEDIVSALSMLSDEKSSYDSPTDGVVFDGGFTRAIRLMAWEEPILQSYVLGYAESYGIHYISPEVIVYPILRSGGRQRQIAITNWQRIIDNDLRPGYPIAFRLASGATADFDKNATKLLQERYAGHYEEYKQMIEREEQHKAWLQNNAV